MGFHISFSLFYWMRFPKFYLLNFTFFIWEVCEVFTFYLFLVTSFLNKIMAFYTSLPDIIKTGKFQVEGIAVSI